MIIKCWRKPWLKRKLKKVQVQMSDQCHSLLKEYANAWNMTMSEVMYECTRHHIHKHSNTCEYIDVLFRFKDVKKDKRLSKDCYGCGCFSCNHITSCRTGVYQGNWEINPDLESYTGTNQRKWNNKQYYLLPATCFYELTRNVQPSQAKISGVFFRKNCHIKRIPT